MWPYDCCIWRKRKAVQNSVVLSLAPAFRGRTAVTSKPAASAISPRAMIEKATRPATPRSMAKPTTAAMIQATPDAASFVMVSSVGWPDIVVGESVGATLENVKGACEAVGAVLLPAHGSTRPVALLHVPAAQGTGAEEPSGQ
jgi:hypothetical protein